MTENQQAHHEEQIEALRTEFYKLWADKLEPRGVSLTSDWKINRRDKLMSFAMDIAWHAFRAAKGF